MTNAGLVTASIDLPPETNVSSFKKSVQKLSMACIAGGIFAVAVSHAKDAEALKGNGRELVMFTITASNVYGANQIKGAVAAWARASQVAA